MAGVFQNIDPPPPLTARRVCTPRCTPRLWGEGGWGVNILEDVRHSSVLYLCKYFANIFLKDNSDLSCCDLAARLLCSSQERRPGLLSYKLYKSLKTNIHIIFGFYHNF
jgi:hypothetical protein